MDLGALRIYCDDHLSRMGEGGGSADTAGGPIGAICPTCHMATPAGTGICDNCES